MDGSAIISSCGLYRTRLERVLGPGPAMALIGVNPSTADASVNDATIRKDMGFARRLGYGRIIKGNLFAFRSKDVRALRSCAEPIGSENDAELARIFADADTLVMCWGPLSKLPPHLRDRWRVVVELASRCGKPTMCFGTAKDGHPRHTLMLAYETPLIEWRAP